MQLRYKTLCSATDLHAHTDLFGPFNEIVLVSVHKFSVIMSHRNLVS